MELLPYNLSGGGVAVWGVNCAVFYALALQSSTAAEAEVEAEAETEGNRYKRI